MRFSVSIPCTRIVRLAQATVARARALLRVLALQPALPPAHL